MSKIEVTKEQAVELVKAAFSTPRGGDVEGYGAMLDKAIELGLVRPASDDLAARVGKHNEYIFDLQDRMQIVEESIPDHPLTARVAALEAKVNGKQWDKAPDTYDEEAARGIAAAHNTPDPHAAAKERAKLWGVELVRVNQGEGGDLSFASKTQYWNMASWLPLGTTPVEKMYGFYKTTPEAWSNFPTEPPPGWEAPKDNGFGDNDSWTGPAEPKPRTEADSLERLAEVAYEAWHGTTTHRPFDRMPPLTQRDFHNAALAVRKAVLAGQLEPSEEEVKAAAREVFNRSTDGTPTEVLAMVHIALIAAARVRLEKAEGEKS